MTPPKSSREEVEVRKRKTSNPVLNPAATVPWGRGGAGSSCTGWLRLGAPHAASRSAGGRWCCRPGPPWGRPCAQGIRGPAAQSPALKGAAGRRPPVEGLRQGDHTRGRSPFVSLGPPREASHASCPSTWLESTLGQECWPPGG